MTLLQKTGWLVSMLLMTSLVQAQTCKETIKQSTPDARYTIQAGGEEVFDNETQLIWKRCAEGLSGNECNTGAAGTYTWAQALALTDNTWRLPNIKELASLVETACYYPAINLTVFPNTPSSYFWSSSPYAYSSNSAWLVAFGSGTDGIHGKDSALRVRLVRGVQ